MNYNENTLSIPNYDDGKFEIFSICQTDEDYSREYLKKISNKSMWYQELSISDSFKFDLEQREKKIVMKIRIPQTKEIDSMNVLKIGNSFLKVYNAYHFVDKKDGFKKTDLTLEEYKNVLLEDEIDG